MHLSSLNLFVRDSPVTVTGSRRTYTGFPFQLSSSHLSAVFTCRGALPASPPPKGDRIIGCAGRHKKTPPGTGAA